MRRLLGGLARMAMRAALLAGLAALVRYAIGRLSGEPGVPATAGSSSGSNGGWRPRRGGLHTPMSFDEWPPVPQAPGREERQEP
jgi:hypothetical protein